MVLYLTIISVAVAITSTFNIIFNQIAVARFSPTGIVLLAIMAVLFEFIIDGVTVAIIHTFFPKKWFSHERKFFKVAKGERAFYDKIKIKSWKEKVWELGALGGFRKNKIKSPNNTDYLERFIIEGNIGVTGHFLGIFLGFVVILILPKSVSLSVGLPIAIVNAFLNILPICILRYNIPKLKVALTRAQRQTERCSSQIDEQFKDYNYYI